MIFQMFFLVCKLYKLGLYMATYFGHEQCFISEFLVLEFIKTKLKTEKLNTKHYFFLAIFPDLEITQLWSVNYIFHVCK